MGFSVTLKRRFPLERKESSSCSGDALSGARTSAVTLPSSSLSDPRETRIIDGEMNHQREGGRSLTHCCSLFEGEKFR